MIVTAIGVVVSIYKAPTWAERYAIARKYWPYVVRYYPTVRKYVDLLLSKFKKRA